MIIAVSAVVTIVLMEYSMFTERYRYTRGWGVSIKSYFGNITTLEIPSPIHGNAVIGVGAGAFWECTSLESIEIPDSVETIGSGAFYMCTNLKSISINANTEVASDAFEGCNNISITYR